MTAEAGVFTGWARRWMDLAEYRGREVPHVEERIEAVIALWHESVPGTWKRGQDARLLDRDRRYCRTHTGGARTPRGEHAIEHQILDPAPDSTPTVCLGGGLIDGVNAVPLAQDAAGGRAGNVEADMLLLLGDQQGYRLALVEVKSQSNHPWYATIEALRQLRLFSESAASQRLFQTRQPELDIPDSLPTTAVVLAAEAFYKAPGRNAAGVAPTKALIERIRARAGVDARLATWDPRERIVEELSPI